MEDHTDQQAGGSAWRRELSPRQVGCLILCLIVPVSAYYSLVRPLAAVHHGDPASASLKWTFLLFVGLVLGVGYSFFPAKAEKTLGSWRANGTPLGWAIWVVTVVAMLATHAMVASLIRSHRAEETKIERMAPADAESRR